MRNEFGCLVSVKNDGTEIVLLTNQFDLSATTIAKVYRFRWQIELFFKALKQNLKIQKKCSFYLHHLVFVSVKVWESFLLKM